MGGSVGSTDAARVFKGKKMPGRMGGDRTTVKNLEIVEVDASNNELLIKGALPGARGGLVMIVAPGELQVQENKATKQQNNKEAGDEKKDVILEERPEGATIESPEVQDKGAGDPIAPATPPLQDDGDGESEEKDS